MQTTNKFSKTIYIGCDHAGVEMKDFIKQYLTDKKVEVKDMGTYTKDSVHYPVYAEKVCQEVQKGNSYGILVCGTGSGISIMANKFKGIRCSICNDYYVGLEGIKNDSPNIIAMGERVIGQGVCKKLVDTFMETPIVEDEAFKDRVKRLAEIENLNLIE